MRFRHLVHCLANDFRDMHCLTSSIAWSVSKYLQTFNGLPEFLYRDVDWFSVMESCETTPPSSTQLVNQARSAMSGSNTAERTRSQLAIQWPASSISRPTASNKQFAWHGHRDHSFMYICNIQIIYIYFIYIQTHLGGIKQCLNLQ